MGAARDIDAAFGAVALFVERHYHPLALPQRHTALKAKTAVRVERRGGAIDRKLDDRRGFADPPRKFNRRLFGAHVARHVYHRRHLIRWRARRHGGDLILLR